MQVTPLPSDVQPSPTFAQLARCVTWQNWLQTAGCLVVWWWYGDGMAEDIKQTIRLSPELHERLDQAAQRDRRSMHAQMITYIERGLAADDRKARRAARREVDSDAS
jgi:hypothetical protein